MSIVPVSSIASLKLFIIEPHFTRSPNKDEGGGASRNGYSLPDHFLRLLDLTISVTNLRLELSSRIWSLGLQAEVTFNGSISSSSLNLVGVASKPLKKA